MSISLENFSLRWRFTDPKYNILPKEVLSGFRPLDEKSANELATGALNVVKNFAINPARYPKIDTCNAGGEPEEVRKWLTTHLENLSQDVAASWNPTTGMMVRLKDFCDYWDDFCYPGSDDVIVLPEARDWVLYYMHEELFSLGRRIL